ncbi:hypothetical protein CGLAUT_07340 [Corynebacterium glaucum]|uniref:Rv2732c family membrane protein n=1 Tax=Corynebacterium glaucum TaxID=187491 RepID=UPI0025B4790D|nr:hypothetical protein [Corynebacterium glaucum]WJZ07949.1 hypothetical protein CGLAUT_07340 [Corynebacterium glaucum]
MAEAMQPASMNDPDALARTERKVSGRLADGPARWVLLACTAAYLVAMFLPFAGAASGWQLLGATEATRDTETAVTEYLFTWVAFIGLGVLTPIAVLTRRFAAAVAGWMVTGISSVCWLLAMWLGLDHGAGIYVAIAAVLIAIAAYIPALGRRGEQQLEIARQRAAAQGTDDVARLQRSATEQAHAHDQAQNPLLIDDRRARAAERHKRQAD